MNTETAPSAFVEVPRDAGDELRWLAREAVARAVENIDSGPGSMSDVIWAAWTLGAIGTEFDDPMPEFFPEGVPPWHLGREYVERLVAAADDLGNLWRWGMEDAHSDEGRAYHLAHLDRIRRVRAILEAAR